MVTKTCGPETGLVLPLADPPGAFAQPATRNNGSESSASWRSVFSLRLSFSGLSSGHYSRIRAALTITEQIRSSGPDQGGRKSYPVSLSSPP